MDSQRRVLTNNETLPICVKLFEMFTLSARASRELFLITPKPSTTFCYRSSALWSLLWKSLAVDDASITISSLKSKLKKILIEKQNEGDEINWIDPNFIDI